MSGQDRKANLLIMLAANFGREFPPELFGIWLDLLGPYDWRQVEQAVKAVIRTYDYKTLPPFAVLQRELDRLSGGVDPDKALAIQAEAEWARLIDAIGRYGSYQQPELHETTEHVLRTMGGWLVACQWETARLEWRRREFVEAWKLAHEKLALIALGADAVAQLAHGAQAIGMAGSTRALAQ